MALFYLVRHGSNDWLGNGLAGRMPGVHLNDLGRTQAERLAACLADKAISRIISSPLERARETADPLARALALKIEIEPGLTEVDFGGWSGKSLVELQQSPEWKLFNSYRSGARIPGGETMLEVQNRMVKAVQELQLSSRNGTVAIFGHADPLKSLLAYYLGVPLDFVTRLEISPGSFSVLKLELWGPQILAINSLPA